MLVKSPIAICFASIVSVAIKPPLIRVSSLTAPLAHFEIILYITEYLLPSDLKLSNDLFKSSMDFNALLVLVMFASSSIFNSPKEEELRFANAFVVSSKFLVSSKAPSDANKLLALSPTFPVKNCSASMDLAVILPSTINLPAYIFLNAKSS